mgnify:CR=1 FL=1
MSGRKKNRKQHRNGQPPGELLSELHSLRELLGSVAEADIPLLDQVADAGSNPAAETTQEHTQRPPRQPVPPPRPLEEADLPILFSPVDEEPVDDFAPQLSEADLELLRPLQNLPRNPIPEPRVATPLAEKPIAESTATPANSAEPSPQKSVEREEFQPELFDPPRQPIADSVTATEEAADTTPPVSAAENKASERVSDTPAEMANTVTANTIAAGENPFLPPHIRARLTGVCKRLYTLFPAQHPIACHNAPRRFAGRPLTGRCCLSGELDLLIRVRPGFKSAPVGIDILQIGASSQHQAGSEQGKHANHQAKLLLF